MESPAFGAAEQFVEGTIAAALVALWLLAVALHLARPYMLALTRKFTLRLGADLWWTIYVGMRDVFLLQVFLGSFIFFYPDVVKDNDMPITGGLAAVCAFAALLLKLMTRADADARSFNAQTFFIGLGATLYLLAYLLGVQVTTVGSSISNQLASILVTSQNQTVALALCYLSALLVAIMGLVAVAYNLRMASPAPRGKPDANAAGQPAAQI
ncbi:MAG: hypothetical protein ABSA21_08545 [Candidatus Limnocylindrales bacterium]|jgi:hypothetical protein